jgi:hypothetical protein
MFFSCPHRTINDEFFRNSKFEKMGGSGLVVSRFPWLVELNLAYFWPQSLWWNDQSSFFLKLSARCCLKVLRGLNTASRAHPARF